MHAVQDVPRGDGGAAGLEHVAVLAVAMSVLASVLLAVEPAVPRIRCTVEALVQQVLQGPGERGCTGPVDPGPVDPGPVDPGPVDPGPVACADDLVADGTTTFVGLGCRYVPVPPDCPQVDPATATPEQVDEIAECAGGRHGPPSGDQDDPTCRDALPSAFPDGDRTTAQVGCRDHVIPIDCAPQLEHLEQQVPASLDAARAAGYLADCITTWYDRNQTSCVVGQSLDVDRFEIVALFFIKIAGESAFLVEELGDGRIRVHLINGSEFGVEVSTPDGVGPSASVGFLSGYETDETYEFPDKATAQDWISWHGEVLDAYHPGVYMGTWGGYRPPSYDEVRDEPRRRKHSSAETDKKKVAAKFGVDASVPGDDAGGRQTDRAPKRPPRGSFTGAVEVEVEQEVEVEDRLLTDPPGWRVQTYKTSDTMAAAMLLQLGGKAGRFGVDLKAALDGGSVKGSLSVTQVRRADGTLDRLVVTADDTLMNTLSDIGVDVSVVLPYGFSAHGGWSRKVEEGTSSVVQTVLPTEALTPEQAARADELANTIFPRDDDGTLSGDDVDLAEGWEELGDLVEAEGTARTTNYGIDRTTETDVGGIDFAGLPLLEVTQIEVSETQDLTHSSLDVVDVANRLRTLTPAPSCDLKSVDPATYAFDPDDDLLTWDDDDLVRRGEE